MPELVIVAGEQTDFAAELVAALEAEQLATLRVSCDDVVWLSRTLNPAAVLIDVESFPDFEHPIYELSRLSAASGLAVVGVRRAFDDSEPCEAPRLVFVSQSDGAGHVREVVRELVRPSAGSVEIGADGSWTLGQ